MAHVLWAHSALGLALLAAKAFSSASVLFWTAARLFWTADIKSPHAVATALAFATQSPTVNAGQHYRSIHQQVKGAHQMKGCSSSAGHANLKGKVYRSMEASQHATSDQGKSSWLL